LRIVLLYSQDSPQPVARLEIGAAAKAGNARYARVAGRDTVVTIPDAATDHLKRLIELAGNTP
jgi:hypothetical protein